MEFREPWDFLSGRAEAEQSGCGGFCCVWFALLLSFTHYLRGRRADVTVSPAAVSFLLPHVRAAGRGGGLGKSPRPSSNLKEEEETDDPFDQ